MEHGQLNENNFKLKDLFTDLSDFFLRRHTAHALPQGLDGSLHHSECFER